MPLLRLPTLLLKIDGGLEPGVVLLEESAVTAASCLWDPTADAGHEPSWRPRRLGRLGEAEGAELATAIKRSSEKGAAAVPLCPLAEIWATLPSGPLAGPWETAACVAVVPPGVPPK